MLSADEIKKEKDCEEDLNRNPSNDSPSSPQDLSIRSSGDSPAAPTNEGETSSDGTADADSENRQGQENSRKLTNFFIDDILRSDFGPKRCRHGNNSTNNNSRTAPFSSSSLSSPPAGLPLQFSSPVLSFSSSATHTAKVTSAPTKTLRTDILTPPPSSPESSSSSSLSLSPGSLSLLSPSSSASSHSRHSPQSPKKEARSLSQATNGPSTSPGQGSNPGPSGAAQLPWPAWVYCTRYSDRPSSGPRYRKPRQNKASTEKRPRTAFSSSQLHRLRTEFQDCPYLSETRRMTLARELGLTESQVKIWFQNKRAKLKKGCGVRNPLAQLLIEEGLYNHSTIVVRGDKDDTNSDQATTPTKN